MSLNRSWYFLADESQFSKLMHFYPIRLGSEDLVVIKLADKSYKVYSGRCPHMNAPLSQSEISFDEKNQQVQFRCSFHHWKFNQTGECIEIPGCDKKQIPAKARLKEYPMAQRAGSLFIFWGEKADFDLPFFENLDPQNCQFSKAQKVQIQTNWTVGPANAFDIAHFTTMHQRVLECPPVVTNPTIYSRQIFLQYSIHGKTFSDRVMRFFYSPQATLNYVVFRGNFILAETRAGHLVNRMLMVVSPLGPHQSLLHLFVITPPGTFIKNRIQAYFSKKFFKDEAESLKGIAINSASLGPKDEVLKDYMKWLDQQTTETRSIDI